MGHDHHFLSRLDRVELPHVELALSLYRDHELVRDILSLSSAPPNAERIAISLEHPRQGPFLIVARDGHFVTCLGKGMRPHKHVVTRSELELIMDHLTRLRQAKQHLERLHSPADPTRLFAERSHALVREDLPALRAVYPLIEGPLLTTTLNLCPLLAAYVLNCVPYEIESKRRQAKRHLAEYHRQCWGLTNRLITCGLGSPWIVARAISEHEDLALTTVGLALRASFATIAAGWLVAQLGAGGLPLMRRRLQQPKNLSTFTDAAFALVAIAARHPKCRGEARAALAQAMRRPRLPAEAELLRTCLATLEADARGELSPSVQRAAREAAFASYPELWTKLDRPDEIPLDLALPLYIERPFSPLGSVESLERLLSLIAEAAKHEAETLLLPAGLASVLRRRRDPEHAASLLRTVMPRLERPAPQRAAPAPSRNDVCPCGSGRKYKRCCEGKPRTEAPTSGLRLQLLPRRTSRAA